MRDFVLKTIDFVLKMIDFAGVAGRTLGGAADGDSVEEAEAVRMGAARLMLLLDDSRRWEEAQAAEDAPLERLKCVLISK